MYPYLLKLLEPEKSKLRGRRGGRVTGTDMGSCTSLLVIVSNR